MMRLILARHGNTFGPEDRVVWVGKRNDVPLVEEGFAQALRLGRAISGLPLSAAYCAPLQRTRQFADSVLSAAGLQTPLTEDARLNELDYGQWSGLTDAQITERFGVEALTNWSNHSIWPSKASSWDSNEETVTTEVKDFVSHVVSTNSYDANVLIVSSNGRLRYFLKLVAGEFQKRANECNLKVGTGRASLLIANDNQMRLVLWNEAPEVLRTMLAR